MGRVICAMSGVCRATIGVYRAMVGAFAPAERAIAACQTRKVGPIAGKEAAQPVARGCLSECLMCPSV